MRVIKKQLTRRSLEMMEDLSKQEGGEDYKTFWESFGRNIKVRREDEGLAPAAAAPLYMYALAGAGAPSLRLELVTCIVGGE